MVPICGPACQSTQNEQKLAFPDTQIWQSTKAAPKVALILWEDSFGREVRTSGHLIFSNLKNGAEVAPILWVISLLKNFPRIPQNDTSYRSRTLQAGDIGMLEPTFSQIKFVGSAGFRFHSRLQIYYIYPSGGFRNPPRWNPRTM